MNAELIRIRVDANKAAEDAREDAERNGRNNQKNLVDDL